MDRNDAFIKAHRHAEDGSRPPPDAAVRGSPRLHSRLEAACRTYSSWSHDKGVPGKVVAQLMGHANVDTTLNVYTQVLDGALRAAVDKVGGELFTIVHRPEDSGASIH